MSKAILVIDSMPEKCEDCPVVDLTGHMCIQMCKQSKDGKLSVLNLIYEKPDWCPLKHMPEKNDSEYYSDYARGHKHGWNDAIKAIENNPHKQCGYSNK